MLSPQSKRNISRIIPFGLIWFVFSIVYTQLEKGIIGDLSYYPATGNPYSFTSNLAITPIAALLFGLVIGTIEIFFLNKLFIRKSFTAKLVYKSLVYLFIIFVFLIGLTVVANVIRLEKSFFHRDVWINVKLFLLNYAFLSVGIYMAAIVVISQFYNEVSDNMGHAVLMNFFTGKYHLPQEEERIFMFLDMTASTTIAENLGHVKYFEMLREYYTDLSSPILDFSGEVYQYVGDEIVVSWTLANGLKNNNCIRCFFAMKESIGKQRDNYLRRFNVVPGFRAGFHYGKVTTGEIGAIKKEIIFTGDVLNTTSRIQGLCKAFNEDVLISDALVDRLHKEDEFEIIPLGQKELRGREGTTAISTINYNSRLRSV